MLEMRRRWIIAGSVAIVMAVVAGYAVVRDERADGDPYRIPTATAEDLRAVAQARFFFAHQSVGGNILDGVPAVYAAHGLSAPRFVAVSEAGEEDRLSEARVGENGDPLGKLREFDSLVRSGLGDRLDVAMLKLCYSDVVESTDVQATFEAYRDTLAALAQDYPHVAFVPATVPVTIIRGPLGKVKALLGRGDRFGPEHNVVREEFNALLRAEYGDEGQLFDVAAIESTTPDGERLAAYHDGELFYALAREYSAGNGHLSPTGGAAVAESFLAVVADAVDR